LEESDLSPEGKDNFESSPNNIGDASKVNKISKSPESLEELNDNIVENKNVIDNKITANDNSLFKRIVENGFDGITTNPNYKLLALLIILLINLSLFFLVGNLGKTFLKNTGILS
tara:strand:+ start:4840 stop:5184 length:345 start_codon:yes stop_codon:yes gene_type:complete